MGTLDLHMYISPFFCVIFQKEARKQTKKPNNMRWQNSTTISNMVRLRLNV